MLRAGGVLDATGDNRYWRTPADFALPSEPGNERLAIQEVAETSRNKEPKKGRRRGCK